MRRTEAIAVVFALLLTGAATLGPAVAHRAPTPRKAPRLPRAAPIALQIGDLVTVNGQLFVVGAALIPAGSTPPPPPPPPIALTITGYNPNPAGAGGTVLIQGTGFGPTAQATYLAQALPLRYVSDTRLNADMPLLPGGGTGPVILTVGAATITGPLLTVTATPPPPPPPPGPDLVIYGYRDGQRNPAQAFLPGTTVIIQGANFGAAAGTVKVNNLPVPTQRWADTELEIVAPVPALSAKTGPVQLEIRRPDGKFYASLGFTLIAPPGRKVDF